MRDQYNEQLEQLNGRLSEMGALCEACIDSVAVTLSGLNADGTKNEETTEQRVLKIYRTDAEIDEMERTIEAQCLRLLLKQQPVAGDLRFISAALKMISDMERIGDQASDIAEITRDIEDSPVISHVPIAEMARSTIGMVTDSIDSFVRKNLGLAQEVIRKDDEIDRMFLEVKDELIRRIGQGDSGETCMDLLMIAKYFERIGDHACNIAEWVEYSLTGQHGDM